MSRFSPSLLVAVLLLGSVWFGTGMVTRSSIETGEAVAEPRMIREASERSSERVATARNSQTGEDQADVLRENDRPAIVDSLENAALERLGQLRASSIVAFDSVACTQAECNIHLTTNLGASDGSDYQALYDQIGQAFLPPPFGGHVSIRGARDENGFFGIDIKVPAVTETVASRGAEVRPFPLDSARRAASRMLPPDDYTGRQVRVGIWNGTEVIAENVCSFDCPLDGEQVIRFELTQGQSCVGIGGKERQVTAWSPNGFTERILCVPLGDNAL